MPRDLHIQRYLLTGVLTVFPLWLTWIVFEFVLRQLSAIGAPVVDALFALMSGWAPSFAHADLEWLRFMLAALLTIGFLYALGWLADRVVGRRLLTGIDGLISRIPLVQGIYGGTKKMLAAMQNKPEGSQRVVLIDFPHAGMKAVGLVTRTLRDAVTGQELAAVFVPTTPNPTGGYLEIVPVDRLTPTDWTVDQAMAFILSGGVVSPEHVAYAREAQPVKPA